MARLSPAVNIWDVLKEADLRPLREQALKGVQVAVVGAPGSGRSTLVEQIRRDPARMSEVSSTPVLILDLDAAHQAGQAGLIILMMDSRKSDSAREQALVKEWNAAGRNLLVFINQRGAEQLAAGAAPPEQALPPAGPAVAEAVPPGVSQPETAVIPAPPPGGDTRLALPTGQKGRSQGRRQRGVVWGSALDTQFLLEQFAPAVMDLLPENLLGLARYFPLFRVPVAHYLINDTAFTNATYALTTGLAETVAIADVPIVVADSVILTKNQLFLAYKVGLALGYSTRWQDYIAEFGSVLGSGFVFRQVARSLVGLVPVVGLVPKTAIAYAGTYVVGNAVLQWYLTGRHISRDQMKEAYQQALEQGRRVGKIFLRRRPVETSPAGAYRLRLPKLHLPRLPKLPHISLRRGKQPEPALPVPAATAAAAAAATVTCPACGRPSAADAQFCQYCGRSLK